MTSGMIWLLVAVGVLALAGYLYYLWRTESLGATTVIREIIDWLVTWLR